MLDLCALCYTLSRNEIDCNRALFVVEMNSKMTQLACFHITLIALTYNVSLTLLYHFMLFVLKSLVLFCFGRTLVKLKNMLSCIRIAPFFFG